MIAGPLLDAAAKVIEFYEQNAKNGDRIGRMIERVGIERLKKVLPLHFGFE